MTGRDSDPVESTQAAHTARRTAIGIFAGLGQDLRASLRLLRRKPAFGAICVLTLALGIGANTAVFSVVNAVLLRPLPYGDGERVVWIWTVKAPEGVKQRVSYPDFQDWRAQSEAFESLAGWNGFSPILSGAGEPQKINAALTLGDLFTVLGVRPLLGTSAAATRAAGQPPAVVLGHALWERAFDADPEVIGRQVTLDGLGCVVVAVMPAGFRFPIHATPPIELWMRVERFNPALARRRDARLIETVGRLRQGVTIAQAQAEMELIAAHAAAEYPETNAGVEARVVSAREETTASVSLALLTLWGAVGCVLLIACVNVAHLQLARTLGRREEIATRAALGAGRFRIGRQMAIESLALAAAGGIAGGLIAVWTLGAVKGMLPADVPRVAEIDVDLAVLGFTLLISLLAGLVFGLAPVMYASGIGRRTGLDEAGCGSQRDGGALGSALVIGEIALAMTLLAGAGLFVRSFWQLSRPGSGFEPRNVLTFTLDLPSAKYRQPARAFGEIRSRLTAIPGVEAAGAGLQLPDRGGPILEDISPRFAVEGRATAPEERPRAEILTVQPDYFRAMGIPLARGRGFTSADREGAPRVIVVNESLARAYLAGDDPLGARLQMESWVLPDQTAPEVVGVAADVTHAGLGAARPLIYVAMAQFPRWSSSMVVRTDGDPLARVAAIRAAIHGFDPELPIGDVRTLQDRIDESVAGARFDATLLGGFAILALVLAALGLYGVLSFTVARRTREIGVRMAIGAEVGAVRRLLLFRGLKLAIAGIAIGIAGAMSLTRLAESLLFGVSPTDPLTLATVAAALLAVAALAAWIPARRATRVDPVIALRSE